MSWEPPSPRCGHPMEFRDVNTPRNDLAPVCWRRKGHAEKEEAAGRPARHLSRYAYLNELTRGRRRMRARRKHRKAPQSWRLPAGREEMTGPRDRTDG